MGSLKKQLGINDAPKKLMGIELAETYKGFTIITDSIKMIVNGTTTSYVFPVKPASPMALIFQNLTIIESPQGTSAFVTTYTPTVKWVNSYKDGNLDKFEGETIVTPVDLNNSYAPLANPQKMNDVLKNEKISSTSPIEKIANAPVECVEYTFYYREPYICGSGNHYPGYPNCTLTGNGAAGYAYFTSTTTVCNSGGGGGGTTPNPPPGYNPCTKTIPMVDFHGVRGERLAVAPLPGTPCDLPPLPPPPKVVDVDPNARQCLKDIKAALEALGMKNTSSGSGLIANVLNKLNLSTGSDFKAIITEGVIPPKNIAATTWESDQNGNRITQIKFSEDYLNRSTDLKMAGTMMHEYVHAYFDWNLYLMKSGAKTYDANFEKTYKLLFDESGAQLNDPYGTLQHEQIAKSFIKEIATMLKSYAINQNIPLPADPLYFEKIGWGGLFNTSLYKYAPDGTTYTNSAEAGNNSTTITQTLKCKK